LCWTLNHQNTYRNGPRAYFPFSYSYNNKSNVVVKHINIKYYVIDKKGQGQIIELKHIITEKMRSLKGFHLVFFPPNMFKKHIVDIGLTEHL
jgi:hypothetical protein